LPDLAALWMGVPLRADVVSGDPDGWASDPSTYVGNGPFMLADWVHQDHLTLVPNPQYVAHLGWPLPTLTKVTMQMQSNPEGVLAAYQSGKTPDWMVVPDVDANSVLDDPILASQSRKQAELTTLWLQLNAAHAPLNNVFVRRALSRGIDRAAVVRDLAAGVGTPATSVIPAGMPGFQAALGQELGFDAVGARALLAQAGLTASPTLTYVYRDTPADLRRAQYVQDQLGANLGLNLELKAVAAGEYAAAIQSGTYDLAFGGWSADYPDPQDWLRPVFGCGAPFNTLQFCDSTFDQVTARADSAATLTDRIQLYGEAQTELMQDLPVVPLFNPARLILARPWVAGLTVTPVDDYAGSLFLDEVQILPH
jgi:oligopeptide transport system substrate-binding protein